MGILNPVWEDKNLNNMKIIGLKIKNINIIFIISYFTDNYGRNENKK
jgi:hypothetical protein